MKRKSNRFAANTSRNRSSKDRLQRYVGYLNGEPTNEFTARSKRQAELICRDLYKLVHKVIPPGSVFTVKQEDKH